MRSGIHADLHDEFQGDLGAALARCESLMAADKAAERKTTQANIAAFVCFLAALGAFVWLMLSGGTDGDLGMPAIALAGSLLAMILALLLARAAAAGDFEDRRLLVVERLLRRLGPELKEGAPIAWHIDFRAYDRGARGGSGEQVFEQQWLTLDFVLKDGAEVRCEIGVHAKQKRRQKRKYTKIKERFFERLIVRLRPPKGATLTPIPQQGGQLAQGKLRLHRARVRPRGADLEWRTAVATGVKGRGGWGGDRGAGEISPARLLLGVIGSHKLVATGQRSAR